ncbi:MAG: VOC family protein, partial [Abiotrophia defectiva]|nr:VOC family protein [Abiotrophia defectiva]
PYQMPEGSRIGHIHLSVQDSKRAAVWWNQVLGMETKFQMSSAAWMSSGTYHHQLAANQWAGSRLAPQEPDQAGLKHFSIVAGSPQEEAAIVKRAQDLGAKVQGLEGGWQVTDSNGISLVLRSL